MKRGISGNVHSFPGSLFAFRQEDLSASVWENPALRKWQGNLYSPCLSSGSQSLTEFRNASAFLIQNTPANPGERNDPVITGDDRVIE